MKLKPYQLVIVQEDGYRFNGQVMSFETPSGTAMVRRVPGHPGTMEEMPVDKLSEIYDHKNLHWVHYAKVAGRGSFPVDMLRYDFAAPVNFSLVENRYGQLDVPVIDATFGLDGLWIASVTRNRKPSWTDARWSSFWWTIQHRTTMDLRRGDFEVANAS